MAKNWEADANAATTVEARQAHKAKCPQMIVCLHLTSKKNEYGDCANCEDQTYRMCPCQEWTWEQLGQ